MKITDGTSMGVKMATYHLHSGFRYPAVSQGGFYKALSLLCTVNRNASWDEPGEAMTHFTSWSQNFPKHACVDTGEAVYCMWLH